MKIAMILSARGFHWDEALVPFNILHRKGWQIVVATPGGTKPVPDPASARVRPLLHHIGYGTAGYRACGTPASSAFVEALHRKIPIEAFEPDHLDAIYLVGGHGCLLDLHDDPVLNRLLLAMLNKPATVAAICHASSILARLRKPDGSLVFQNRPLTGFPTLLEHLLLFLGWVDRQFLPLPLWTGREIAAKTKPSAVLRLRELIDMSYVEIDRNVVTGVGPKAARRVAMAIARLAARQG